jgi:hypothetical protein
MDQSTVLYMEDNACWQFDGNALSKAQSPAIKKMYTGTFVPVQALYMYSSKLPSSMPSDQREIQMDISMHEEGGAKIEETYTTAILSHPLPHSDEDLVDIFGLEESSAKHIYGPLLKKTGVIDYILPPFLMYEVTYGDKVSIGGTELFLYLGDEEAYGVIYQQGHYVSHRIIDHLAHVALKCGIEVEELKELLKTKGLEESDYTPEQMAIFATLQEMLAKSVERIIHTLNHKRGLFGLDALTRIVLDFEGASIKGLEELFHAFGLENIAIEPLIFDKIDPVQSHRLLGAKYLLGVVQGRYKAINISPFLRKPPFWKQPVGVAVLVVLVALAASGFYLGSLAYESVQLQKNLDTLNAQIKVVDAKHKEQVKQKTALEEQKLATNLALEEASKTMFALEQSHDALLLFESAKKERQKALDEALKLMHRYKIGVRSIEQNSTKSLRLHVQIPTQNRAKIASFIEGMAQIGYNQSKTERIFQNETWHESMVEVAR